MASGRKKHQDLTKYAKILEPDAESADDQVLPYICNICDKGFSKMTSLLVHVRIHTGERPFVCKVCGLDFTQNQILKKHMTTHSGEKPHKCFVCLKSFLTSSTLKQHLRIHTGEKPHVCPYCNEAFRHRYSYHRHVKLHSGDLKEKCKYCSKFFKDKATCNRHIEKVHRWGEEEGHFVIQNPISRTANDEIPGDIQPISKLKKGNPSTKSLQLRVKCKYCSRYFVNYKSREAHIKVRHHSDERYIRDMKNSMESISHESFIIEKNSESEDGESVVVMRSEVDTEEENGLEDNDGAVEYVEDMDVSIGSEFKNPLRCHICRLVLCSKQSLKQHLRVHTGEKLFACGICRRRYSQVGVVRSHLATHKFDKPYECTHCGQCYKTGFLLKVHILQEHHKEKGNKCRCHDRAIVKRFVADNGQQFYKCHYCEIGYLNESSYKTHLYKHEEYHYNAPSPSKKGQKPPKKCPNPKPSSTVLKQIPFKKHSTPKPSSMVFKQIPFKCDWCQETFDQLETLNIHIQKHVSKKSVESQSMGQDESKIDTDIVMKSTTGHSGSQPAANSVEVFNSDGMQEKSEMKEDKNTLNSVRQDEVRDTKKGLDTVEAEMGKTASEAPAKEKICAESETQAQTDDVKADINADEKVEMVKNIDDNISGISQSNNDEKGKIKTDERDETKTPANNKLQNQSNEDNKSSEICKASSSSQQKVESVSSAQTDDNISERSTEKEHMVGGKSFDIAIAQLKALEKLL